MEIYQNVAFGVNGDTVVILDQTALPNNVIYEELKTPEQMYGAIKALKVRGAPAIGICAAFCFAAIAKQIAVIHATRADFDAELLKMRVYLESSRPTAVNLSWALKRMERVLAECVAENPTETLETLKSEALEIRIEDEEMCKKIAEHGLSLLKNGDGILTHCNAGPLATSRYGTALGPIILGTEHGRKFRVFADETRPLLQGARLTTWELMNAGVDITLICDNMAAMVMKNGWVDACFVGCDRIAANGDTANKIGTMSVAILAKHFGVPFYVLGPGSTIDMDCKSGADIEIEQRDPAEITEKHYAECQAPEGVKCYNPAFDVTPAELITGIVTEKGILYPPYADDIARLFR